MTNARVDRLLEEIARLSPEEQAELLRELLRLLEHGSNGGHQGGTSAEDVQQAIQTRERIRQRLAAAQQSPGSIDEDLEEVRNDRLEELLDSGLGAVGHQVRWVSTGGAQPRLLSRGRLCVRRRVRSFISSLPMSAIQARRCSGRDGRQPE